MTVFARGWDDGMSLVGLWVYQGPTKPSLRNETLWRDTAEARKPLIADAQEWRLAALADGWTSAPTYEHEPELHAFTLRHHEGWHVHGLARPADVHSLGCGLISAWGPDGLVVDATRKYDLDIMRKALFKCDFCNAADVTTHRVGFANRCCLTCLPEQRKQIEYPGWSN